MLSWARLTDRISSWTISHMLGFLAHTSCALHQIPDRLGAKGRKKTALWSKSQSQRSMYINKPSR